jgi:hypothetical protein
MNSDKITVLTTEEGSIGTRDLTTNCINGLDDKLSDIETKFDSHVKHLKTTIIEEKEKLEKRCDDLGDKDWHNVIQMTKLIFSKEEVLREEYEKKLNYIWIALVVFSFAILFLSYMMNRLFLNIL